jgi:hypothetical protein
VRWAATLTLSGLRAKLLARNRAEPGFDVGGYQDREGRIGVGEQIRRVLCKPEISRTHGVQPPPTAPPTIEGLRTVVWARVQPFINQAFKEHAGRTDVVLVEVGVMAA